MGHSCCFQNPWWNFYAGVDPHVGSFFMILIWPGGAASGGHVLPLHWLLKNQVSGIRKPMRIWHVSKESAKAADRFASCMDPSSGRWGDILGKKGGRENRICREERILLRGAGQLESRGFCCRFSEAFWVEEWRSCRSSQGEPLEILRERVFFFSGGGWQSREL